MTARCASALITVVLLAGAWCPAAIAQEAPPDDEHTPREALWRAAAIPGWGQIYNGQYYKLPFVYGGLGAFAYGAVYTHQRYRLHQRAYWYAEPRLWTEGEPDFPEFEESYQRFLQENGLPLDSELSPEEAAQRRQRLAPSLRQFRDNLRRNRDLLYVGLGLFYGLTIVDAFVSAHLLNFDLGEDLSISVYPGPTGMHARLSLSF